MRYQMVIQADSRSMGDYDRMLALEEKVGQVLATGDIVDGHDAGAGEWNIFLEVTDPRSAFAKMAEAFDGAAPGIRVAYRELGAAKYTPLFPPGLAEFRVR